MTRRIIAVYMLALALVLNWLPASALEKPKIEYLTAKPLVEVLKSTVLKPIQPGTIQLPTITWAGDLATIEADRTGAFKQEGLDVKLFKEDDFAKQVQDCINGKTPYVRGTMGMINVAAPAFKKAGTELVVIYQLTWSSGGDVVVGRSQIKSLKDLAGKTVALQRYGPHMDYISTLAVKAGIDPATLKFRWMRNLTPPLQGTGAVLDDTVSAFQADSTNDACVVIAPDAGVLTNGSAEGSVKGAREVINSGAANRIIADVYAVRKDYFDAHPGEVKKMVHALMVGEERYAALMANKDKNMAAYNDLINRAAVLQWGDAGKQSRSFVEGALHDCTWVGFNGNVQFFTGKGTSRNFNNLNTDIQAAFKPMNLMTGPIAIPQANWNYSELTAGLKNANVDALPKPLLSQKQAEKVKAEATRQIAAEPTEWESNGTLYSFEVNFRPNQDNFDSDEYADSFKRVFELSQSLGGAVVFVEGHAAPNFVNSTKKAIADAKRNNASQESVGVLTQQLSEYQQAAKSLGLRRAKSVCDAYARYCKTARGQSIDASQLQPISLGADSPKVVIGPNDIGQALKEKTLKCMRVVFRMKQVQAEPSFE